MRLFFDAVRPLYGGQMTQAQVDGLNRILAASHGLPRRHRAYVLATVHHETGGRMQPVRETFAETDGEAIDRLEAAWRAGKLPWVSRPYWRRDDQGKAWFGRGDVQITHRDNYLRMGQRLGVDLVEDPTRALHPEVSARIAVIGMAEGLFTGKRMADFESFVDMRRVVNGADRAVLIAGHAEAFDRALAAAEAKPPPIIAGADPEPPPIRNPLAALLAALAALLSRIFGGRR